jgi:hypothetical protein
LYWGPAPEIKTVPEELDEPEEVLLPEELLLEPLDEDDEPPELDVELSVELDAMEVDDSEPPPPQADSNIERQIITHGNFKASEPFLSVPAARGSGGARYFIAMPVQWISQYWLR